MTNISLPVLSTDSGLTSYMEKVNSFPYLNQEEEYMLAKRWSERGDIEAAQNLVKSHLRLVVKIAMGFRGYGLPIMDVISEGNIGLMQAVKKFDIEKGFRLSTYAMWWIKASIQEYVLKSWSLVKIGTTSAQKKLFFNLRRLKGKLLKIDDKTLSPDDIKSIANELSVSESEVVTMDERLSQADSSLNISVNRDDSQESGEMIDFIAEERDNQELVLVNDDDYKYKQQLFVKAFDKLNDREKLIIQKRRLDVPSKTLEDLSKEFDISRERVRQIEARAMEKLQLEVLQ